MRAEKFGLTAMRALGLFALVFALAFTGASDARGDGVDTNATIELARAVIVVPDGLSGPENQAVRALVEEARARSGLHWEVLLRAPRGGENVGDDRGGGRAAGVPVIAIGPAELLRGGADKETFPFHEHVPAQSSRGAAAAEGFHLRAIAPGASAGFPRGGALVVGNDERGVVFGVGKLLRSLRFGPGSARLARDVDVTTAPRFPLRGHQLGYRPKTNSYDGWDLPQWDRYVRELTWFGTNAIELIPPRSDDAATSPHFPRPPLEMMAGMSKIAGSYGLDVWIWYPAMDEDYSDAKTVARAIEEWGAVFRALPRVDAVFVPGGDPGHTRPKSLLALLEKQAENLHRYHPGATMWVSPQSFSKEWYDEFIALLKDEPKWLSGVVFGPQVRVGLPELRKDVPARYPVRRYPDITHSKVCQYPVPDWDLAFALTEGRETINPRPIDESKIFHAFADQAIGFISYSEGCNDDVNKIVWSALGWSPDADLDEVLRDYARVLAGLEGADADGFAQGLFALERNWRGPLLSNRAVKTTLQRFQALERRAAPRARANWRFQQALYRAYYDAYERRRLLYEAELEEEALDALRRAPELGTAAAMKAAEGALEGARLRPVGADLKARVRELGEALFQSIHMQLSVPKYQAIGVGRGANLDTIDVPLNNRDWLLDRFARIEKLGPERERLGALREIVEWGNPGPGGRYDQLGDPTRRPRRVAGATSYDEDPAGLHRPLTTFDYDPTWRRGWCRCSSTLLDQPLKMRYEGLDPNAEYRVKVIYGGDSFHVKVRLVADDTIEIHPFELKPRDMSPRAFDVPRAATADGRLELTWTAEPGRGGNGRGCQVCEVWLMRK